MSAKNDRVCFDFTDCGGVEPVFEFDAIGGAFRLNRSMTMWLLDQAASEGRLRQREFERCVERVRRLAWRMGEAGQGRGTPGAQLASTGVAPARAAAA